MTNFKFSPIKKESELLKAIRYIHLESYKLCKTAFGKYLANAGNIGIFCHFDDEYLNLTIIKKELTYPSNNPDQKYFTLLKPIIIPQIEDLPEIEYKYLYIRKPREDSPQVGDLDFYFEDEEFKSVKSLILKEKEFPGARIYDRVDLNMIELFNPNVDVVRMSVYKIGNGKSQN